MRNLLFRIVISGLVLIVISFLLYKFDLKASYGEKKSKRALLVGISKYDRGRGNSKDWRDLNCSNDIVQMKKILIEKFGFKDEDVHVLLDEKASLDSIKKEFNSHLIDKAAPGDIIVFHFSGHGQQMKDDNGDEIDGKDECFVPFDYRLQGVEDKKNNPRLIDDEIKNLLKLLTEKMKGSDGTVKGDILITIDSCHSGTGTRGSVNSRGRGWDEKSDGPEPKGKIASEAESGSGIIEEGGSPSDYTVISACKTWQTAKEDTKEKMGVFTRHLINALEKMQPTSKYCDLYENLCTLMVSDGWSFRQDPQIEGNLNKLILNGQAQPSSTYLVVKPLENTDMIEIPAGDLHGITKGSFYAIYKPGSDISNSNNIIAEAEIIDLDLSKSQARITRKEKGIGKDLLMAAKAVEIAHNYGTILKLFIYGKGQWAEELKKIKVISTQESSGDDYDIKIYHNTERSCIIIEHKDGYPMAEINDGLKDLNERIHNLLLAEWRKRFLRKLDNRDLNVEIKVVKVNVETAVNNPKIIEKELGAEEVTLDKEGKIVIREGEWITFKVRNLSEESVFITILELDSTGAIFPVFPGTGGMAKDIIQDEKNSLPPDEKWYRLPIGAEEKFQKRFVWKAGKPYGDELIKLIATKDPVDFSPLVDRQMVTSRGEGDLLSGIRGTLHPLALLLYDTNDGGNRGLQKSVSPGNWGTANLTFEVKR